MEAVAARYRLMADAVLNHCSSRHAWFQAFLAGDPDAEQRFITVDPDADLLGVVRRARCPY